jgi:hypothetical protein
MFAMRAMEVAVAKCKTHLPALSATLSKVDTLKLSPESSAAWSSTVGALCRDNGPGKEQLLTALQTRLTDILASSTCLTMKDCADGLVMGSHTATVEALPLCGGAAAKPLLERVVASKHVYLGQGAERELKKLK